MRIQFVKYFVTGVSAVFLDMATLYYLKEHMGFRPVVAVVINQIFILGFVFFINKYWTFKSGGMTAEQIARFLVVAFGNYIFAVIWMLLIGEKAGVHYLVARITNIVLAVSWNFLLYRYFVYRFERVLPVEAKIIDESEEII